MKREREAAELLADALQLGPDERAQLAAELLASLDEHEDDVEKAWAEEITRRAAAARKDSSDELDWRAALSAVQSEVLRR